jgi:thiamine biosynthesis protein ThiS
MKLLINGKEQSFPGLDSSSTLTDLVNHLQLTGDRVAVEHNGQIVSRSDWSSNQLSEGDKLEIVHFVGGGSN